MGLALEDLIRAFSERGDPFAKALYWIGGPRGWAVHVPRRGGEHKYDVYRDDDLVVALTKALTGEGGVPEKDYLDELARKATKTVVLPGPPPSDMVDLGAISRELLTEYDDPEADALI